ncbi:MAG: redoxin domain-containing protein [Abitibacteriaceae bacterium]|nr:redoxin domain-containing protein [Abditibacteriaceae bacterium]
MRYSLAKRASLPLIALVPMGLYVRPTLAQSKPAAPSITAPGSTNPAPGTAVSPAIPSGGAAPPLSPATPAAPTATPAKIDAAARQMMEQMIDTYKKLKSYSGLMQVKSSSDPNPQGLRVRILYQKPNRVVATVNDTKTTTKMVSNGTNMFVSVSNQSKAYLKVPVRPGPETITSILLHINDTTPGLAPLAGGFDPLIPYSGSMKSLTVGSDDSIGGVPVATVIATLSNGKAEGNITYAIGKTDHLLRRVVFKMMLEGQTATITENHSELKTDFPVLQNAFAFIPPPGAKALDPEHPQTHSAQLKVGGKPFAFKAIDLTGKPINLAQYQGKVVLLDFWATWCMPCLEETPNVVNAYNKWKRAGFDVIGVSLDEEKANVHDFIKQFKMPWRQIFDGHKFEGPLATRYGVMAIPTNLLIGRDGKIVATDVRGPALETAIRAALRQKS